MSFNDLAAFDPIFFFHHCNVDRLYALWEYVYPDYWFGKGHYNRRGQVTPFSEPLAHIPWMNVTQLLRRS